MLIEPNEQAEIIIVFGYKQNIWTYGTTQIAQSLKRSKQISASKYDLAFWKKTAFYSSVILSVLSVSSCF